MSDLPEPLTPADCDLRGLDYMPLLGNHLFGSEFNARAADSEWRAAVTLWWAAWTQKPAASLPDDDIALCRLADLGRDLRAWKKIKKMALYGFVKCSDGRLYHKTLAEQANIAFEKRIKERERKSEWREKRAQEKQALNQNVPRDGTGTETGTGRGRPHPTDGDVPSDGNRRDGTGRDVKKEEPPSPPKPKPADDGMNPEYRAVMEAAGFIAPPPDFALVARWKEAGADLGQDILPTLRRVSAEVRSRTGKAPFKLQLFDRDVRAKVAEDAEEIERLRRTTARIQRVDEQQTRGVA